VGLWGVGKAMTTLEFYYSVIEGIAIFIASVVSETDSIWDIYEFSQSLHSWLFDPKPWCAGFC